jgi:hypothetical protein
LLIKLGNRIWVGLHDDPPLELELAIDPIIADKSIQLDLVNRLIQHQIKALIRDQLMLPKMQDFPFWMTGGAGGFFQTPAPTQQSTQPEEDVEEEVSSENALVFVDEVASVESIATASFESSPSVEQNQSYSGRRRSIDSTSSTGTTRVHLAGPLAPYVSESAVDYIASTSVYGKAIEYGIDTRVRDLAGWFGVEGWIRVEHDEIEKIESVAEEEELIEEGEFEEESEEAELKGPANTPASHDSDKLAATRTSLENAIYRSESRENLPEWAKAFAVDLIKHCADAAVENSTIEEKVEEVEEGGDEVIDQETFENTLHTKDSGVFYEETFDTEKVEVEIGKLDESKALLDFLSLLKKSSEGRAEFVDEIESVKKEEVVVVEQTVVEEIKIEVLKEKVGEEEKADAGMLGWFAPNFVLDLWKPRVSELRIVNVYEGDK